MIVSKNRSAVLTGGIQNCRSAQLEHDAHTVVVTHSTFKIDELLDRVRTQGRLRLLQTKWTRYNFSPHKTRAPLKKTTPLEEGDCCSIKQPEGLCINNNNSHSAHDSVLQQHRTSRLVPCTMSTQKAGAAYDEKTVFLCWIHTQDSCSIKHSYGVCAL